MSIARTSSRGITHYDPSKAYNGYTLFTPLGAKETVLIDMKGRVVHQWKMLFPSALHGVLLNNGDLFYSGYVKKGPLADLKGAGGELLEIDWDGDFVWNYKDPYLHHSFYRMPNGNTMILRWVQVPKDIATKVKGGIPGTEKDGIMWCDSFQEISPNGKVLWEWVGHDHLDPETDVICPLCPRNQWTEANSFTILPNGDILASFTRTHTICVISKDTGDLSWRWGAGGELAHQTDVSTLENGNILLFDNGTHCVGLSQTYSRVLEVNPTTKKIVWEYKDDPWMAFYSAFMSSCQRLPNDNTLICEAITGRLFEATRTGSIVWEFVNPFPRFSDPFYGHNNIVPRAYRYGPEYEGLRGKNLWST